MKKLALLLLLLIGSSTIWGYTKYNPYTGEIESEYSYYNLPKQQHITPNGRGGYSWYENSSRPSKNIWENLPKQHTLEPDGNGGYYYNEY